MTQSDTKFRNSQDRKDYLFGIIENEPYISHNNLLRKIVNENQAMAKNTCEHMIKDMLAENIISSTKDGNKKLYSIKTSSEIKHEDLKLLMNRNFEMTEFQIRRIKKIYKKFSLIEKTRCIVSLLKMLHSWNNQLTGISVLGINRIIYLNQKSKLESLIALTLDMIEKDRDVKKVGSLVLQELNNIQFNAQKEWIEFLGTKYGFDSKEILTIS